MAKYEFKLWVFLILVAVTSVAAQMAGSQTADANIKPVSYSADQGRDDHYRVGFQDTLDIQVFRHPELAQKVTVNADGTIDLFRLDSPILAVCKTEKELSDAIVDAYKKDYLKNPEVHVVAIEQRSQAFSVIGAVEKPGSYFINHKVRLLELLAQAGGPSKEAGTRILVARLGSTSNCKQDASTSSGAENSGLYDFRINDILEAKENLFMEPGDVVSVKKTDVVYVYGNVNEQGQVPLKEQLTLTQALASSKGLKAATKKDNVRILRQKPGSLEREDLVFDLNAIDKHKVQDPFLQPNDIIAVSEDKTKSIVNAIGKSLTQGVSTIFYRVP